MHAQGLVDACLQIFHFLNIFVLEYTGESFGSDCLLELGNQLLVNPRVADDVKQDGTGRVGGRVGSSDQLSQGW